MLEKFRFLKIRDTHINKSHTHIHATDTRQQTDDITYMQVMRMALIQGRIT